MNKFNIDDLVRIINIRKFNEEGTPYKDYENLLEYVGLERKITRIYNKGGEFLHVLDGIDVYAWYEDELELVNAITQPVTEEELLSCFGREDD